MRGEQTPAARLADDDAVLGQRVGAAGDAGAGAAVGVGGEDAPLLVHHGIVEVEQVARARGLAVAAEAAVADGAALHRVVGRDLAHGPVGAAVIGHGDVGVPVRVVGGVGGRVPHRRGVARVAGLGGAEEEEAGTLRITGDDRREDRVANAVRRADVDRRRPGEALVVGHDGHRLVVALLHVADVERAVGGDGDGGVPAPLAGARNGADLPALPGVLGDDERLAVGAALVRQVDGAVGRHLGMPVQATALQQRIDGHAGAEGHAAVVAARAVGGVEVLRAVVDGVGIGVRDLHAGRIGADAERLVVEPGLEAAADAGLPAVAVGVAVLLNAVAGAEHELRGEDAPGVAIGDEDGVGRLQPGERAGLVLPGVAGGRDAVVELDAVHLGAGDEEDAAGLRVDVERRLGGAVADARRRDVQAEVGPPMVTGPPPPPPPSSSPQAPMSGIWKSATAAAWSRSAPLKYATPPAPGDRRAPTTKSVSTPAGATASPRRSAGTTIVIVPSTSYDEPGAPKPRSSKAEVPVPKRNTGRPPFSSGNVVMPAK